MNVVLDLIGLIMHPLIGQILVDCNDTDLQEASIISSWRAARRNLRGSFASKFTGFKKSFKDKTQRVELWKQREPHSRARLPVLCGEILDQSEASVWSPDPL